MNEGVVSKETVVLRRWGSSIQKFGFINGVDNVNWPPYRDSNKVTIPTRSTFSHFNLRLDVKCIGSAPHRLLLHPLLES